MSTVGYLPVFFVLPISRNAAWIIMGLLMVYMIVPLLLRKNVRDKHGHAIPPGPLLRYAFLRKYPERSIHAWALKYGSMFSLWMGNQLVVVINDPHVARDLLVNNGAIFSSRKRYFMKNQTILNGLAVTSSQYDDTWRKHRRIAMWLLTPKAIQTYANVLDFEAHILVRALYHEGKQGSVPVNPSKYAGRYVLNNMLTVAFGMRTESTGDPLVEKALQLATEFMELTGPLSNAIDFIEPLQWIPTPMRRRGQKLHDDLVSVYGAMITQVKVRMESGEDVPACLVKSLLEHQEEEQMSWEDMCMLCAVYILGGVHSTVGIIQWFLALMPSHPRIQARAHEELDRVVGQENWPTAEDEERLPYIRAITKEVQRVHAPFLFASPHFSTEDFVYHGHYIPKETVILLNAFTLHRNEQRYPDAETFNPERYINDDLSCAESAKLANAMDRDHWTFGAGRRFCPGVVVASRELWLAISRLLWTFNIHPLPDEPISLEEYEGSSGRTPLPYRVRLVPRHERVNSILEMVDDPAQ